MYSGAYEGRATYMCLVCNCKYSTEQVHACCKHSFKQVRALQTEELPPPLYWVKHTRSVYLYSVQHGGVGAPRAHGAKAALCAFYALLHTRHLRQGQLAWSLRRVHLEWQRLAFTKARTWLCSTHSNLLCITRNLINTTLVLLESGQVLQHPPLGTASHYRVPPFARACHMMQHPPHPPLYQPQPQRPLLLREASLGGTCRASCTTGICQEVTSTLSTWT